MHLNKRENIIKKAEKKEKREWEWESLKKKKNNETLKEWIKLCIWYRICRVNFHHLATYDQLMLPSHFGENSYYSNIL